LIAASKPRRLSQPIKPELERMPTEALLMKGTSPSAEDMPLKDADCATAMEQAAVKEVEDSVHDSNVDGSNEDQGVEVVFGGDEEEETAKQHKKKTSDPPLLLIKMFFDSSRVHQCGLE
jgi:hypothetical protein